MMEFEDISLLATRRMRECLVMLKKLGQPTLAEIFERHLLDHLLRDCPTLNQGSTLELMGRIARSNGVPANALSLPGHVEVLWPILEAHQAGQTLGLIEWNDELERRLVASPQSLALQDRIELAILVAVKQLTMAGAVQLTLAILWKAAKQHLPETVVLNDDAIDAIERIALTLGQPVAT